MFLFQINYKHLQSGSVSIVFGSRLHTCVKRLKLKTRGDEKKEFIERYTCFTQELAQPRQGQALREALCLPTIQD